MDYADFIAVPAAFTAALIIESTGICLGAFAAFNLIGKPLHHRYQSEWNYIHAGIDTACALVGGAMAAQLMGASVFSETYDHVYDKVHYGLSDLD
jgi:hypothetical protein